MDRKTQERCARFAEKLARSLQAEGHEDFAEVFEAFATDLRRWDGEFTEAPRVLA
jgi:hypothetical protein